MATNFIKWPPEPKDEVIDITASAPGLAAGAPTVETYDGGSVLAVSLQALGDSEAGRAAIVGVWRLPKDAVAIGVGDRLNWQVNDDGLTNLLPAASGDLVGCAVAVADAKDTDDFVQVKLTPGTATVQGA